MGYFSDSTYYKFKSLTVFYSKGIQYSLSRCGQQSVQRILGHSAQKQFAKLCEATLAVNLWNWLPQEAVEAEVSAVFKGIRGTHGPAEAQAGMYPLTSLIQ